jgi:CubicO group peptidase (beta-lactamase class C family)
MKLVEAGQLDLNDRAFSLLNLPAPQYPGTVYDSRLTNITVRQLLNHTAGWIASTATNPLGGAGFDPAFWTDYTVQDLGLTPPPTPTDFVRWMMGKPLQANPGSQWFYSNAGFIVAGRAMEKITAQTFETAARQLLAEAGITRVQLGGNTLVERLWSPVAGEPAEPSLNADATITVSVNAGSPADSSARFFRLRVSRK